MRRWVLPVLFLLLGLLFLREALRSGRQDDIIPTTVLFGLAAFTTWTARRTTEWCVLCVRPRQELRRLVAGRHGAVCDACVGVSIGAFDADPKHGSDLAMLRNAVQHLRNAREARLSRAQSATIARITLLLEGDDLTWVRRLVGSMLQLQNPDMALTLADRIPPEQRTPADLVNRAAVLYWLGRYAEGIAAIEGIDEAALAPDLRALVRNNRAACTIAQGGADAERLRACRAQLEEARDVFEDLYRQARFAEKDAAARVLASVVGTLAHCAFAEGRFDESLKLLARAEVLEPRFAWRRLLKARVFAAYGEPVLARSTAREAVELAHPESREHAEALALSAGPATGTEPYAPPSW